MLLIVTINVTIKSDKYCDSFEHQVVDTLRQGKDEDD